MAISQDILATLSCIGALGAHWERKGERTLEVTGMGGIFQPGKELPHFDCGESGSTLRFLIPIALAVAGGGIFTGRGRLMERPQEPYIHLFHEKGISWNREGDTLTVLGQLKAGDYELPGNVSSQFFTGLLYALPLVSGISRIVPTTHIEGRVTSHDFGYPGRRRGNSDRASQYYKVFSHHRKDCLQGDGLYCGIRLVPGQPFGTPPIFWVDRLRFRG